MEWPRLFRYAGKFWFFEGLIDYCGNLLLVDITDDSKGISAKPIECHEVIGTEYQRQIEGIEYFKFHQSGFSFA